MHTNLKPSSKFQFHLVNAIYFSCSLYLMAGGVLSSDLTRSSCFFCGTEAGVAHDLSQNYVDLHNILVNTLKP